MSGQAAVDQAVELYQLLGQPSGLSSLVRAVAMAMPWGTEAKLEAIDAGATPPGSSLDEILDALAAGKQTSWTCWPMAMVTAAVAPLCGAVSAGTVAMRRDVTDKVDVHSVVLAEADSGQLLLDPTWMIGPIRVGSDWTDAPAPGSLVEREGRLRLNVDPVFVPSTLAYVQLTGPLDPDEVRFFCDLSTRFSGMAHRPKSRFIGADVAAIAWETEDGGARMRVWDQDWAMMEDRHFASYDEARSNARLANPQ